MANSPIPPGPNKSTIGQIGDKSGTFNAPVPVTPAGQTGTALTSVPDNTASERQTSSYFVEVHAYDARGRYDMTPWCKACDWTVRLTEPWTTISVTVVLPWANRDRAPLPGDWIVVRDSGGRPVAWGMVDEAPEPGVEGDNSNASIASRPLTFRTISWLSLLRRAALFVSPPAIAGRTESVGTLFSADDWLERSQRLLGLVNGDLGAGLIGMVTLLGKLKLPPSLGGGNIGDGVFVVTSDASAAQGGVPWLACDPVRGPRIMGTESYFPGSGSVLDTLLGTFQPDKQLIEAWETLAPLAAESNSLRSSLGATPVLVYRIRPWRTQALGPYLSQQAATIEQQRVAVAARLGVAVSGGNDPNATPDPSDPLNQAQANALVPVQAPDAALVAFYSQPSWLPQEGTTLNYELDGVNFPTPRRSDSERVNVVTVGLPTQQDSPTRFWPGAGLPFKDDASIERFGVRLFQPNWPFFPPSATNQQANSPGLSVTAASGNIGSIVTLAAQQTNTEGSLIGYMRVIAGLSAMMFLGRERFLSGSVSTGYVRPRIKIGVPMTVIWPDGRRFVCYPDAISHSVRFGEGNNAANSGNSSVSYSRGAWSGPELRDNAQRLPVAVPTSLPVATQNAPAAQDDGRCHRGTVAATWPTRISTVNEALVPASLVPWAVERGFRSSDFDGPGTDQRKRSLVAAACARAIEYYWRQSDRLNRIVILSSTRAEDPVNDPSSNHSSGASFDFAIQTPLGVAGVLQTWGSLFRLSEERRIPLGGRGLYLNLSPSGIEGTAPYEAGASSSREQPAPGGSSAGVHYDFRGTFGFRPDAPSNKWVALDLDGNGVDEYMLGRQPGSAETLPILEAAQPSVYAYFQLNGATDTYLPRVTDTVPNALQMLGLQEWCADDA